MSLNVSLVLYSKFSNATPNYSRTRKGSVVADSSADWWSSAEEETESTRLEVAALLAATAAAYLASLQVIRLAVWEIFDVAGMQSYSVLSFSTPSMCRVTHLVSDYILLTLNLGVTILPTCYANSARFAEMGTSKSKSTKCSRRPDRSPCISSDKSLEFWVSRPFVLGRPLSSVRHY